MNTKIIEDFKKDYLDNSTQELLAIWKKKGTTIDESIRKECLEAIRQILVERGFDAMGDSEVFITNTDSSSRKIQEVMVVDISIPFWSMVVFMVKWTIASIPAFIILIVIASSIGKIFGFFH